MIISVRGANGVGKSTLLRYMLEKDTDVKKLSTLVTYSPKFNSYILGKYYDKDGTLKTSGGGFDLIGSMAEQTRLLIDTAKKVDKNQKIWYEGAMTSTIYSTWDNIYKLAEEHNKHKTLIVFLNYPRDVCVKRIIQRSGDKARYAQIDSKIYQVNNAVKNFKKAGYNVLEIADESMSTLDILKAVQKKSKEIRGV